MNLFIVGATGATGENLVQQALEAQHQVTVYVRNPQKITMKHPQLKVVTGSLAACGSHLAGHDAFLSALGHTEIMNATPYLSQAFDQIIPALRQAGVRRVIYESAYGIGETAADLPWFFRVIVKPYLLKHTYADHELVEKSLMASGLNWTILRPTGLVQGPLTQRVVAAERLPKGSKSQITRADVAAFMLKALDDKSMERRVLGLTAAAS